MTRENALIGALLLVVAVAGGPLVLWLQFVGWLP